MLIVENIFSVSPIVFGSFPPVLRMLYLSHYAPNIVDDVAYNTFFLLYLQDLVMLLFEN